MICKNCQEKVTGGFCNNCGQKTNTHRLDTHHIFHDVLHAVLHIENGFFFTCIQLMKNPYHVAENYIYGKRIKYTNPLSLLFVLSSIYSFAYLTFDIDFSIKTPLFLDRNYNSTLFIQKILPFVIKYYAFISLLSSPFIIILHYFFGRKTLKYNPAELFTIEIYKRSNWALLYILIAPILIIFNESYMSIILFFVTMLLYTFYEKRQAALFWKDDPNKKWRTQGIDTVFGLLFGFIIGFFSMYHTK